MERITKYVSVLSYPYTIVSSMLLFTFCTQHLTHLWSAYIAVGYGAIVISLHEWKFPFSRSWYPDFIDLSNDTIYLVLGQGVLERLLMFGALFLTTTLATITPWRWESLWIHNSPLWMQAVAMLVVGDFFRYWLHRAFHRFQWMWRLHAVHHSPKRLYWVNVGRFHPFEQALQFVVDAFVFILLGVQAEVFSIYFVFYAVNGFYQHSNCLVRLGWLNWIVAGPELHRWHHSLDVEESNHNYGNNLILWDLIFGTRYLPKTREVNNLGVPLPNFPVSVHKQFVAPFDRKLFPSS